MATASLLHTTNFINHKTLADINTKINNLDTKLDDIEKKLDHIIEFFEKDVKKNCDKMGEHIDFIETVYDTVKSPLGYLCNKISYVSGNKKYTLTDVCNNSDFDSDEEQEESS